MAVGFVGAVALVSVGCGATRGPVRAPDNPAPQTRVHVRVAGRLPSPVQDAAGAPTPQGDILLAGGLDRTDRSVAAIVRSGAHESRVMGRLPSPVHDATAASQGGFVYVIGGRGPGLTSQRSEILAVTARGRVTKAGTLPLPLPLPLPLSDAASVSSGHRIFVAGGRDRQGVVHDELLELRVR
jgi:hypothetical protein